MATIVYCGIRAEIAPNTSVGTVPVESERTRISPGQALYLGRGRGVNILVKSSALARSHALLALHPPGSEARLCVVDLMSTNGTWVHGERIAVAFLEPGQSFRVADQFEFRFEE